MNRVAADGAIARRAKAHAQSGRSRGADIEIRVAKRLVSQSAKGNRLVRLRNAEDQVNLRRGIVVCVAALRSIDLA